MNDHQHIEDAIAAAVLGVAEAVETEAARAHLRSCASCRGLAARLAQVTRALPLANSDAPPPDRLRARILASAAASSGAEVDAGRTAVRSLSRTPRWRLSWPTSRLALAGAAMGVFVLGSSIGLGLSHLSLLAPQSSAPPVGRHQLQGTGTMYGARASVVSLSAEGITLIDFKGLPAVRAGRVYELWLIGSDGKPVPATVFGPDADGGKVVVLNRSLTEVRMLAVTVEPGPGGSPSPSEKPQLEGTV